MFDQMKEDIRAVMDRDPAAKSVLEVMLCYPGYRAIRRHRRAHRAYMKGHYLLARIISAGTQRKTGIDIHPGAQIGRGFFIDHGTGVVIGETTVIGDQVTLYQGVTLGGTGKETGKRHPTLGSYITVGSGAKVLGPITIGDHVKIGAGAVVLKSVPDNCTVVGNPGRVVRRSAPVTEVDLDQVDLPDPVLDRMTELRDRMEKLEDDIKNEKQEGEK